MSLPREWSFYFEQQESESFKNSQDFNKQEENFQHFKAFENDEKIARNNEFQCKNFDETSITTSNQEMVGQGINNENLKHHDSRLGSLFSIHSAPVYDVSNGGNDSPRR